MVKLAIGGKTVTVSQYAVKLVGNKEYDKYSKDLSESMWTLMNGHHKSPFTDSIGHMLMLC